NPSREPATPAAAPAAAATPAGVVTPSAPISLLLDEPGTGALAAVTDSGTTLQLIAGGVTRPITLPGKAAALAPGKPGEILVAVPGKILRVDAASGTISEVTVDGDVRAVALRPDGGLVAGLGNGKVLLLDADGTVRHSISGLSSADAIDARDGAVVVLDRRQTAVVALDGDSKLGLSLRAGDGATNMIGDHFGRRLVTDTAGGELLVYTADPLVLHQRFPVGSAPYALAYDQRSETVWVTLTGSNEVVGYDLSTGIPVEVGRYPTVRQPNAVTIDDRTGDMFVGSATGDGLQRIGADQRKRGQ
ncbi:YncE family protein, partial [Nocardia sp. JMUB6875]|uniref:YncE family protein n=1 Tax=Nocardia sp. JMUB6875 TaxID=3158170 RepID=UPI0034E8F03D